MSENNTPRPTSPQEDAQALLRAAQEVARGNANGEREGGGKDYCLSLSNRDGENVRATLTREQAEAVNNAKSMCFPYAEEQPAFKVPSTVPNDLFPKSSGKDVSA